MFYVKRCCTYKSHLLTQIFLYVSKGAQGGLSRSRTSSFSPLEGTMKVALGHYFPGTHGWETSFFFLLTNLENGMWSLMGGNQHNNRDSLLLPKP